MDDNKCLLKAPVWARPFLFINSKGALSILGALAW